MKELFIPMMFDNSQALQDAEEIGRLTAQVRNLSHQLANQQAIANNLRNDLAYSQQAAQSYAELAESYRCRHNNLCDTNNKMFEDPHGLQAWVQYSLLNMRGRLATKPENNYTDAERREINKGLVAFAYVLWKGMTRFMRLYVEAEGQLQALLDRVKKKEDIPEGELGRILFDVTQYMVLAQDLRLPSWPGLGWNPSSTNPTLRERILQAQQTLKNEMEGGGTCMKGGEVIFEPNGNRLIPGPVSTRWKGGIRTMLEEDWGYIMGKQFK